MPNEVILPRVDMDMATGKISKWLVAPGATVTKGQPLFEIETDKATMEIEAEASGTIRDLAEAGSADIPVGSVVAWIFGENEPQIAKPAAAAAPPPPPAETRAVPPPSAPSSATASSTAPAPSASPATNGSGGLRATPLARRLAREQGIALDTLRGSGPRGRIQAADIVAPAQARIVSKQPEAPQVADLREPHPDTVVRAPVPQDTSLAPAGTAARAGSGVKLLRDGTGMPVVLVHGFGSEANSWRPFLQAFDTKRPVYAVELPGHGAAALGTVNGFDDLVEAVGASAGDLGAIDVVAHSLGAAVMTAVAARGLADVRSLLLLAPAGLGPEINGGFVQGFLAATSEASLSPWMHELVADPQVITPAFVRSTLKAREGSDRVSAQRRVAAAVFPDGTQGFSVRADLARLRIPTRVVFGSADRIIPARHAAALPPLVALHVLPNVGHMPYLEARETVAAILAQAVSH